MWILSNELTEHSTKLSVRMHLSARSLSVCVWHSWIVNCENCVHGIRNQTKPNHAKPKCSEDDLMHVIINEENKIKTLLPSFVGISWMLRLDVHIMFVFFLQFWWEMQLDVSVEREAIFNMMTNSYTTNGDRKKAQKEN